MGTIYRSVRERNNRCPDSGAWVHPSFRSKRKPETAWCGCCGRYVRIDETNHYAEHKLGTAGTTRTQTF